MHSHLSQLVKKPSYLSGNTILDDMKIPTYLDIYLSSIRFFYITLIKFNRIAVFHPLQNKI